MKLLFNCHNIASNFKLMNFSSKNTITPAIKNDSVEFSKEIKEKTALANSISKKTSIDFTKAMAMVEKYYKSEKLEELMNNSEMFEEKTAKKLSLEEAIVYLNYNLEYDYELSSQQNKISPLELAPYLDKGLSTQEASEAIKAKKNMSCEEYEKFEKKYFYFLNIARKNSEKFYMQSMLTKGNFSIFASKLAQNPKKFNKLREKTKDENISASDILSALYNIGIFAQDENLKNKDIIEIINYNKFAQTKDKTFLIEQAIEEIVNNKKGALKSPLYASYVLINKHSLPREAVLKSCQDITLRKNLEEVVDLISKNEKKEPKSGLYRIMTIEEAIEAVKNKLNKKQMNEFLTYIDYEGADAKESAIKASKK